MPGGPRETIFRLADRTVRTPVHGPLDIAVLRAVGFTGLSRSLKYGRPRFPYCHHEWCPHNEAVVNGRLVAATETYLEPGARVEAWCPASSSLLSSMHSFLRPGFYNSLPVRMAWPIARRLIAGLSGLPSLEQAAWGKPTRSTLEHVETGVLVVGGGLGGLNAAAAAARSGASVMLVESHDRLGGRLGFYEGGEVVRLEEEARSRGASILLSATYIGRLPEGHVVVDRKRRRILVVRAKALVYAGGSVDALPIFEQNDLPGIIASDYALRLVEHGYVPRRAVVLASRSTAAWASRVASTLSSLGAEVVVVARDRLRGLELPPDVGLMDGVEVERAIGRCRVRGLKLATGERVKADMVVAAAAMHPLLHPALQAGGRPVYCGDSGTIVPMPDPDKGLFIAGSAAAGCMDPGSSRTVGEAAAEAAMGRDTEAPAMRGIISLDSAKADRVAEWLSGKTGGLQFTCLCSDLLLEDLVYAYRQGYRCIEKLKRFTALGTGICQGKLCMITALLLLSAITGESLGSIGLFRQRAPAVPVEIGLLGVEE